MLVAFGGETGIRTLGSSFHHYNGLANRRLKPLGHLSRQHPQSIHYSSLIKKPLASYSELATSDILG
jgi:hypothetical protein